MDILSTKDVTNLLYTTTYFFSYFYASKFKLLGDYNLHEFHVDASPVCLYLSVHEPILTYEKFICTES